MLGLTKPIFRFRTGLGRSLMQIVVPCISWMHEINFGPKPSHVHGWMDVSVGMRFDWLLSLCGESFGKSFGTAPARTLLSVRNAFEFTMCQPKHH